MTPSTDRSRHLYGAAGAAAALAMLAAQLIWRVTANDDGVVQAFPELVAAAIARLTPLDVFATVTESYGSLAKKTLLVVVCLGVVAVGARAGGEAGRISAGQPLARRFLTALAASALLLLATLAVILPVANLGLFASESSYTGDILTQLALTFLLWAVAWTLLTTPTGERTAALTGDVMPRRAVLRTFGLGAVAFAAGAGVAGSLRRMFRPPSSVGQPIGTGTAPVTGAARVTPESQEAINHSIVATQRATLAETETPVGAVQDTDPAAAAVDDGREVAELQAEATPAVADPYAPFDQLEDAGQLTPVLTTTDDFYHVSKNFSDPTVRADGWTLTIDGMVATPLTLTHDQLVQRATTKKITTLCCISNEIGGDLIGTAEWVGVPLADLLAEVGVQPGVVDLKLTAADDYSESFPLERGLDPDTMVVVGMNGELLRDDHGFPARLIVPGIYGMKNVKWLKRIELVDDDYQGYWQERGWSDPAPYQTWGRIDSPARGDIDPGPQQAAGVASAGDRGVSRVEVSLDDRGTWADALLEPALNPPFTWVRWRFPFAATPGKLDMWIRVTDGAGAVMDEDERSPLPDGATGWPQRHVTVRG